MKNNILIKVSKKYQSKIDIIEKDEDGYWAYLKRGFCFDDRGLHTIHEDTKTEILSCIREIKPCFCSSCIKGEGWFK